MRKDLTWMVFGKLTVVGFDKPYKTNAQWRCLCSCWNTISAKSYNLKSGRTQSCGCSKRTHWMSNTRFYNTWMLVKDRCNSDRIWNRYWNWRGIKCEREKFEDFRDDMYEDYLKHVEIYWEKNTTIDRKNWLGNYCKENCRWATRSVQNLNKVRNIM